MILLNVLGQIIKKVAQKNIEDVKVKTAEPVVWDEVKKKLETVNNDTPTTGSRSDMYKDYERKVLEAKQENEANPNVETADTSVYDDLLAELKKAQGQDQAHAEMPRPTHEAPVFIPPAQRGPLESQTQPNIPSPQSNNQFGTQAITNSPGSLALRDAPSMGAQQSSFRIPSNSPLNILEYSENSIILDGKKSRFVLVEFQGQQGWILESYLR